MNPDNPQTAKRLADGKSLGGRCSEYKPEYCQKIIEYMTQEPWEDVQVSHTNRKGETWTETKQRPNRIKFLQDFAWDVCGVKFATLSEWAQQYLEFRDAYARARDMQSAHLLQNGFVGLSDPVMTKFAAVNLTDLRDKSEVEHSGNLLPVLSISVDGPARAIVESSVVGSRALPAGESSALPDAASGAVEQAGQITEDVTQEGQSQP